MKRVVRRARVGRGLKLEEVVGSAGGRMGEAGVRSVDEDYWAGVVG